MKLWFPPYAVAEGCNKTATVETRDWSEFADVLVPLCSERFFPFRPLILARVFVSLSLVYFADEIVAEAGTGTFGRVLLCNDAKHGGRLVAVKAVRSIPKYVDAAKIEAAIVSDVNTRDVEGGSLCLKYYRSMEWQRHFFIVSEPLGKSLYDYIKANNYKPLPLYCVQSFADQLLTAVSFLHGMGLVHTDLKPENVLLVKRAPFSRSRSLTCTRDGSTSLAPASTAIRLIDFGGATYDHCRKSSLINTRQYRAPEVILGHPWSLASDIWSLGCIFMELYTGRLLFSTHDSFEHLALMEKCLGKFPAHMRTGGNAGKYFHRSTGTLRYWDNPDKESLAHVTRMRKLEYTVHPRDNIFLKFIRSLLQFDPAKRITAAEALNDQLFQSVRGAKPPPLVGPPAAHSSRTGKRRLGTSVIGASAAADAPTGANVAAATAPRRGLRPSEDASVAAVASASGNGASLASGLPPRLPALANAADHRDVATCQTASVDPSKTSDTDVAAASEASTAALHSDAKNPSKSAPPAPDGKVTCEDAVAKARSASDPQVVARGTRPKGRAAVDTAAADD